MNPRSELPSTQVQTSTAFHTITKQGEHYEHSSIEIK